MTRAYDEILLERASGTLGRMLDFAVHSLRQDPAVMLQLFVSCGLASLFEQGDVSVTAGMSGIELAYETLDRLAWKTHGRRSLVGCSPWGC